MAKRKAKKRGKAKPRRQAAGKPGDVKLVDLAAFSLLPGGADKNAKAPEFPEIADPKKRAYVVTLAVTGRHDAAANAAGVSLRTGWNWRNANDATFNEAVKAALAFACDRVEAEIYRRGHDGVLEPVFQQGHLVGMKRVHSDTLLIFLAKALMPEKYRERVEHTGKGGGPIAYTVRRVIVDPQQPASAE